MNGRRSRAAGLAAALALALAACGATGSPASAPPTRPAALAVLPAGAVAYLPSSLKTLTPARLAREAGAPVLAHDLRAWGFQAGSERYFQGESRRLQVVDSRRLRFSSTAGASAFVRFVARHPSPYLGSFASVRTLRLNGQRGMLLIGQPCQCHLANPALLAVLSRRDTVSWLEINGPRANRHALVRLLARMA